MSIRGKLCSRLAKCSIVWDILRKEEADDRIRTYDLLITNQLLYQLSYVGEEQRQG